MNRDETINFWKKCEEARAAAIAEGQSVEAAHEAARNIWNAWAENCLVAKKRLEETGRWKARKNFDYLDLYGEREFGENVETTDWLREASAAYPVVPGAPKYGILMGRREGRGKWTLNGQSALAYRIPTGIYR